MTRVSQCPISLRAEHPVETILVTQHSCHVISKIVMLLMAVIEISNMDLIALGNCLQVQCSL
jgi:hypothetical protein